jgi:hypothetical protein
MKKLVLILAALGACTLCAADFWQTKTFTDWSDKEVEKILKDSPWARTFSVETGKSKSSGGGGSNRGMGGGNMGGGGMGGGGRSGRGGGGGGGGTGMPRDTTNTGGSNNPQRTAASSTILIRWLSALPVKQGLARAQYGGEAATSPDAVRSFERQETQYVVALIGVPSKLVKKGDQMKSNAWLRMKGQDAIPAENAKADLRDNGIYLTLYFPREGHPIKAEDGEVDLEVILGAKTVTQKFKLKNMMYNGKLEL